ncbi:histidine phosphatase super family protein [Orientia chuto str. Dubai]|uniref:Histidine phosphatase super family protein n=1 Tax=Orientia chuto str. Dubai TaxID=1359168 RepID=A0A0F3MM60_9RICK|nr:histidine phosphatase family protein [Candidatus Orientia mediorientalis]KJV56746.1 histidine phosphatase super family protein [Orientia chuto str. Dubai]
MKQTLLMRHGDAQYHIKDFSRPLSKLGKQAVTKAAYFLHKFNIEKVLCSPSIRTLETLNIIKTAMSIEINNTIIDKLYQSNAENIINIVQQQPDDIQTLLIIGHQPSLCEFLNLTVAQNDINLKLLPACIVAIQYVTTSWVTLLTRSGVVYDIFIPNH